MAYTRRPFNPLIPAPNQVVNELNQANENFDILARAFVSDDPETYKVKDAVNSDNAINSQNADTVDGFHASLTPASNTLVPLNANGVLDLSATYVKSNVYTFRRVDLTNATSDYMLQVGEEAIIRFNNSQLVPLRVAIEQPSSPLNPVIYNIVIGIYWASENNMEFDLFPNNTTYSSQITGLAYRQRYDGIWSGWEGALDRFYIDTYAGIDNYPWFGNLYAVYYGSSQPKLLYGTAFSNLSVCIYSGIWNNTSTAWTSLGSFRMYYGSTRYISGIALVRRLA
jgi:hypothetical protein